MAEKGAHLPGPTVDKYKSKHGLQPNGVQFNANRSDDNDDGIALVTINA